MSLVNAKLRFGRWRTPLLFGAIAVAVYFSTPIYKVIPWLILDLPRLNRMVDDHMRQWHATAEYACFYTVKCVNGEAVLELRSNLTQSELDKVKATIWRRRFEGYCPGRTTNFGLENSGEAEALERGWDDYRRRDIWFDGGFVGEHGRFWGGSFAPEGSWSPCTRENAYWTRDKGIATVRQ
jgi:hypothetical protein